jgi:small subunit ribosomal protein S21e
MDNQKRRFHITPAVLAVLAQMQNDEGEIVDQLIPRKCNATGRLIAPKDRASVQFRIAAVDAEGHPTGVFETIVFAGYLRSLGEADNALNRIATEKGLLTGVYRQ